MAVETETPAPAKVLNFKREPKGTNRMAGDKDTSDGAKAFNDAVLALIVAAAILALLVFSLREYIND